MLSADINYSPASIYFFTQQMFQISSNNTVCAFIYTKTQPTHFTHWSCYQIITIHTIYVCICRSHPLYNTYEVQKQQNTSTSVDTRTSWRQIPMNQKCKKKLNESNQLKTVFTKNMYGASMPSPKLTQPAVSIGTSPMYLKCFHHIYIALNYKVNLL